MNARSVSPDASSEMSQCTTRLQHRSHRISTRFDAENLLRALRALSVLPGRCATSVRHIRDPGAQVWAETRATQPNGDGSLIAPTQTDKKVADSGIPV